MRRPSCVNAIGELAPSRGLRFGRTIPASALNTTVTGKSDQNAARQAPISAKTPPNAGPMSVAMPYIPDRIVIARGHKRSSKTRRISAYGNAKSIPPPALVRLA